MEKAAISRAIRVAAGVFAPGHIGELTRIVPFEMVDDVLERTARAEARVRVRLLPARVVVYLLLAATLFAELGYGQVWDRMCAGLGPLAPPRPRPGALRQARQRLGAAPLREVFEPSAGPAPTLARSATRYAGLLVIAIDGTVLSVPDTAANLTAYARHRCPGGGGGYPQLRLLTVRVIDAEIILASAYRLTREILTAVATLARHDVSGDAELLVLRQEIMVLRRRVKKVCYRPGERFWFAALCGLIPRRRWAEVFPVTPGTVLARHRKLIACKYTAAAARQGRRPTCVPVRLLVIRMATENPMWGRRHRSLAQLSPRQTETTSPAPIDLANYRLRRKPVLGGLTSGYQVAA